MTQASPDPTYMSLHALSAAITRGSLTSSDIVECCLQRIAAHDGKLHAFVTVYEDEARLAARAADQAIKSGHRLGPLHGIPIALKDIIDMEGRVTTGGSAVWRERRSPTTATVAQRLINAGMIVIGKTHSVEFAMGGWGTNSHLGTPWNPWDLETQRTPGGSSSGSGVAVAAGMVPAAIGTDTGGSVRLPASYCGLAGLKTTVERVSLHGILPLSTTLDTPGPMTRSVEDTAMIYDAIQGPDPLWPPTLAHNAPDPFANLRRGVKGLRLAAISGAELASTDAPTLAAFEAAQNTLRDLGASISEFEMPRPFADFAAIAGRIIGAEGYRFVGALTDDPELPVDPNVRPRIQLGRDIKAHEYLDALAEKEAAKAEFAEAFMDFDALLLPSTETPAIPLEEVDEGGTPALFTRAGNCLDLCALSLPNGISPDGLPTSLQIACTGYDEAMALRIGWAYEQATDWHTRHPDLG
ncbi:MAG: amidase [Alphaproteobacteria bacterium]|nr:amidase [Alphaproteobacteria bacterium]